MTFRQRRLKACPPAKPFFMTKHFARICIGSFCALRSWFFLCAIGLSAGALAQGFTVAITGPVAAVGPGSVQDYSLVFTNPSASVTLSNVRLNLSLATGLELVNPAVIGCAATTGVQICNSLASLAPQASSTLNFQLRMPTTLSTQPQQSFAIGYSASATQATAPSGALSAIVSLARNLATTGSANPSPVASGAAFSYNLTHTLSGPNLAWDGISISLSAPPQVQLGSASGAGFSCTGSQSLQTCTSSIAALGQVNRSLTVPATASIVPTNSPALANISAVGSFLTGGTASIAQTIVPPPLDLALSQVLLSPSPSPPGSAAQFRLSVRNLSVLGGQAPSGFQVINTLPDGLTLQSAGGVGWSCSGTAVLSCIYTVSLAPQQDSSDLEILAASAASISGLLTNTATLIASGDSNASNNSASVSVSFDVPGLVLQKTGPATAFVGDTIEYRLSVTNPGNAPALDVRIADNLPAGLSLVAIAGAGCGTTNPLQCTIASLAANTSQTITVRAQARSVGSIVNLASATSGLLSVSASATTLVAANVDVQIRKSGPLNATAGDVLTYTLAVNNLGSSPASQIQVTDSLPVELQVVAVRGVGWNCSSGALIACVLNSNLIGGAAAAPIEVEARLAATSASQIRNTASVIALEDRNLSNNSAFADTTVTSVAPGSADLRLTLVADAASFAATGMPELSFSGTLINLGPNSASNVRITGAFDQADVIVQSIMVGRTSCTALNCLIGVLAPNTPVSVVVRAKVNAALNARVSLHLNASSDVAEPMPEDNFAAASLIRAPLTECCDLAISASAAERAVLGAETTITATIRNFSGVAASAVKLSVALTNLSFDRGTGLSCTEAGANLNCTVADLVAGGVANVSLVLKAPQTGNASATLSVASNAADPRPNDNSVTVAIGIDAATQAVITTALMQLPDPIVQAAAPAVSQICTTGSAALLAQCQAVNAAAATGDSAAAVQAVLALLPEEILSQGSSIDQLSQVQFDNLDSRVAELRGGAQGFSMNGLNFSHGRQSFSMGLLNGLFDDDDEEPTVGGSGELISRWGGFVNGSVSSGSQASNQAAGADSDFDVIGITAGVDYRKSFNWVLGGALGYNSFDSDLPDNGALKTKALTLTAYSSFYPTEKLYLDGRVSIGRSQVQTARRILIPNVVDATAMGDADVSQLSFAAAVGYQLNKGAWNFTPNASVRHSRSNFDGFTETGAGDNNARFAGQSTDSTQVSLGMQISRAISLSYGVFAPQMDFAMTRELNAEGSAIDASLVGAPNVRIQARSAAPDQSFGNFGLGFVFVTANGKQLFLSYRRLLAADRLERGTLNFGGRFEF